MRYGAIRLPHQHPTSNRQVPVEPRGPQPTAVGFHVAHEEASPAAAADRLELEAGAVGVRAQEDHAATWLVLLAHRKGAKGRLVAGEVVPVEGDKSIRVSVTWSLGNAHKDGAACGYVKVSQHSWLV